MQLLGEYECKVDAKGRMRLPSGLISQLGERDSYNFVMNRGFEKYLTLFPEEVWDKITEDINKLNVYDRKERYFMRYFLRGAQKVTLDSADRILIPKGLAEYSEMDKDVVLAAVNDRIEVWSKSEYERMLNEEPDDFSDLADEVLGNQNR